jgi:hypothetical protein
MFRIRHYDRFIHPDAFRDGTWRGRMIRVLNWIRWKLETFNQGLVLKHLIYQNALDKEREGELLRKFRIDAKEERIRKEMTSPLAPVVSAEEMSTVMDATALGTLFRQTEVGVRPAPIDALANRYGRNDRSKRYARGKLYMVSADDAFEPVQGDEGR